MMGKKFTNPLY